MTFWECFIICAGFGLVPVIIFGVIYPAVMVIWYKLTGSGLSVKEILKQI